MDDLRAPLPWYGGKSTVAKDIWLRFGNVRNYVEPFCGSCAVLLNRPRPFEGTETVNDMNGWLTNAWRSIAFSPDETAHYADWPVSELDLHSRGDSLFYREDWYRERGYEGIAGFINWLRSDPKNHDPLLAGWYLWGACCWIGTGWGPSRTKRLREKIPHLGDAGRGVNRQLPHLGDAGRGVNRKRPHLGDAEITDDLTAKGVHVRDYLRGLAERMRTVRVCCGDWNRVCGPTPTVKQGLTAVFLDPPYGVDDRADCYDDNEDYEVSKDVREWAIEQGNDKRMRIALCGYEGEHAMPDTWECFAWKARGGYGSQAADGENDNAKRERIWFSPHCIRVNEPVQLSLFAESTSTE